MGTGDLRVGRGADGGFDSAVLRMAIFLTRSVVTAFLMDGTVFLMDEEGFRCFSAVAVDISPNDRILNRSNPRKMFSSPSSSIHSCQIICHGS